MKENNKINKKKFKKCKIVIAAQNQQQIQQNNVFRWNVSLVSLLSTLRKYLANSYISWTISNVPCLNNDIIKIHLTYYKA